MRLLHGREQKIVTADSNPQQPQLLVEPCRIRQTPVVVFRDIGDVDRGTECPDVAELIQMIESDAKRLGTAPLINQQSPGVHGQLQCESLYQ